MPLTKFYGSLAAPESLPLMTRGTLIAVVMAVGWLVTVSAILSLNLIPDSVRLQYWLFTVGLIICFALQFVWQTTVIALLIGFIRSYIFVFILILPLSFCVGVICGSLASARLGLLFGIPSGPIAGIYVLIARQSSAKHFRNKLSHTAAPAQASDTTP